MNNQPETPRDLKLQQENAALKARLDAQVAAVRARPHRKHPKLWAMIILLAVIWGIFILELHLQGVSWSDTWKAMLSSKPASKGNSPPHSSLGTYLLVGVTVALWLYIRIDSARRKRRHKEELKAEAAWYHSLAPLVDISDYPDRDDLYFYLEPEERPRLLDALRRMPKGSRSLRAAVAAVDPDLLDQPG